MERRAATVSFVQLSLPMRLTEAEKRDKIRPVFENLPGSTTFLPSSHTPATGTRSTTSSTYCRRCRANANLCPPSRERAAREPLDVRAALRRRLSPTESCGAGTQARRAAFHPAHCSGAGLIRRNQPKELGGLPECAAPARQPAGVPRGATGPGRGSDRTRRVEPRLRGGRRPWIVRGDLTLTSSLSLCLSL